jgi:branched-chain amino acid transport system substrate-binding protein
VQRLRKTMEIEPFEAIIGPAMSDVSAAVAVDLSARQSTVPVITPTATTDGIAALGPGVFQLNVTTLTLGQTIANHAVDCMKLKEFGVVAPKTEYGYQLAEAFTDAVEQKGGKVLVTQYFDPDASDFTETMAELRKEVYKVYFDQRHADGIPDPEPKVMRSYMNDSTLPIEAFFIPASHGEEAYRVASQIQFSKMRGQFLGSSGWFDKALLMKSSSVSQGVVFSIDFPDNPKTEIYATFSKAYQARFHRAPDKVAALSYDAGRLMMQAFGKSSRSADLIETLKDVHSFDGVLGTITFDEKTGANQSAALMKVDKKTFKDAPGCAETPATAGKAP